MLQVARKYVYVRTKIHDKYVHVVTDTMTSPKNRTNSLLAFNKHLKVKELGGRAERCGTGEVQFRQRCFQWKLWFRKPYRCGCLPSLIGIDRADVVLGPAIVIYHEMY